MKRIILIVAAALAAFFCQVAAAADADCGPLGVNDFAVPYNDIASGGVYSCAPVPSSTSTGPSFYFNGSGAMWAWYCKKPSGTWGAAFFVATWPSVNTSTLSADIASITSAPNPLAAFNAKVKSYALLPSNDPRLLAVRCPFESAMYAAAPKADPMWTVKPNPQSTTVPATRPAFAVVNGVRSLSSTARATVGAACDMSVTITEGSSIYGQTSPGFVTICIKSTTP